jgi:hypothetical protein
MMAHSAIEPPLWTLFLRSIAHPDDPWLYAYLPLTT